LTQTVALDDERTIKFEIWDTAGQERYKALAPMYYRGARVAVVVYDITSATSLEKAKSWIRELQRQADPNIIIALAGNKADLAERREVSTDEAQRFADSENLLFFETSAKTAQGVNEMFQAIARKIPIDEPRPANRPGAPKPGGIDLGQQSTLPEGCAC